MKDWNIELDSRTHSNSDSGFFLHHFSSFFLSRHVVSFIYCELPRNRKDQYPIAVSIVTTRCRLDSHNLLPVRRLPKDSLTSNFTVCVTPLNNNYSRVHGLVEMIEFNRILGADRIAFYNYSITSMVDKVRFWETIML